MVQIPDEFLNRKQKLQQLKELGINPYPAQAQRTIKIANFLESFDDFLETKDKQTITGRLKLKRGHGKLTFGHLEDESGKLQIVFSQKDIGEERYDFMKNFCDVGDILELTGTAFLTLKKEKSFLVTQVKILTKALRPLPEKWKGLIDEEARYRKRYLDLLMNPELRQMFIVKSRFWSSIRSFLLQEGFLEVETPVLEVTPGGADAEPFVTHHNALDIDVYLRISMGELWQKRLMVAGFEKTFEIGRQFRNEGISPEHLQDYTQMEFYWAYADYKKGMALVERMYKKCIQETFNTLKFTIGKFNVDLEQPWPQLDYGTEIKKQLKIDIFSDNDDALRKKCDALGLNSKKIISRSKLIDALWKQCRKNIAGPAFLTGHPVAVSPLAKRSVVDQNKVERFQIIIAGSELGNGYSELNDAADQAERFSQQTRLRKAGDKEAQMPDDDFVEALEYGMPPTCGFGVSERLFSFLMNKSIRECVLFPLLRPKSSTKK
ncbi:MAG: lysine--tRNA ligase [Candidatus Kerfeldbacteria bacterium RIFOXYA2_FULL_38_24]|uniref:Lysine--tRNA ligase n=1 Tax=Candidatus Kerfeldbacteria bacterium RIFOXYB2_FULL_38_14 TaxID=1798547 RepID=A0A1G2BCP6_9BACT|nr:MAG: lysine--tRNA ligase [Candidatus Kerfeldbacteria bacterium RIFOXYA2_FULL_38_24]OGY86030.1 MAG: lysine--tRNA ligase [Candidatus Kerfeldbacteria bacterium RIFOXYB2_FULL_38_14]OGY90146.1 MAG: lysine--tRNA ligase [Candidatus Kerfeldbacteria bacterium RIFOXYC2_FULL_38_9]